MGAAYCEEEHSDDIHIECTKQQERLKAHLIDLDRELEEEARRHEFEHRQLLDKISELQAELQEIRNAQTDVEFDEEEKNSLIAKTEEQRNEIGRRDILIENLQSSIDILESSTSRDRYYNVNILGREEEIREQTASIQVRLQTLEKKYNELLAHSQKEREELILRKQNEEIERKLMKDLEDNVRLIDELNNEINELRAQLARNVSDPNGQIDK